MTKLILYNISINYFIGIISLFTYFKILKCKNRRVEDLAFSFFWLFMVGVNFFEGLRLTIRYLGLAEWDDRTFYINQLFVHLHIIVLGFYIIYKISHNKFYASLMALYAAVMTSIMYFYMIRDGFTGPLWTLYGTEWSPPLPSQKIFYIVFISGMIFFIYDFFNRLIKYVKTKNKEELFSLMTTVAILIYAGFGFFDELGITRNIELILVRVGMLFAPLICYLVYFFRDEYYQYNGKAIVK